MDRLAALTTFVKVVDAGSLAKAAEGLGLTAPMVGRHVRTLEDHLGTQLIARTTRRQSLTEAGRIYYERAKAVLAEMDAADDSVARMRRAPRGRLRINAPVTVGTALLAPLLPDYLSRHPEVWVELVLSNRLVDLVDEGYDAVIRTGELADSSLIARRLAPYRLVACASPSYLTRMGVPKSPTDLSGHDCLGFHPGALKDAWTFVDDELREIVVQVSGPLASDSGEVLRAAAIGGAGVVLQAEALLRDDLAEGRLVRVLDDFDPRHLPLQVLYSATRTITPKLRSFIDHVVEQIGSGAQQAAG